MRLITSSSYKQSGMALVISLIMLLLLTLISVSAMKVNSLEEKMAGNDRDRNIAFQAAEAGLRAGEARIIQLWRNQLTPPPTTLPIPDPSDGTGTIQYFCNGTVRPVQDQLGIFHAVAPDNTTSLVDSCGNCDAACQPPNENDPTIWTDDNKTVVVDTGDSSLAAQPRYFVTYIYYHYSDEDARNHIPPTYKFMVTARGVGKSDKSVVLLRSYFGGSTYFAE